MAKLFNNCLFKVINDISKVVVKNKLKLIRLYCGSIVPGNIHPEKQIMLSARTRYFINDLPDYDGAVVNISKDNWTRFVMDKAVMCYEHQPANARNADGGLYVGVSGLAFMFYHMAQSEMFANESNFLMGKALEIIQFSEKYAQKTKVRNKSEESGFLLGNAGTYAVAAAIYHKLGDTGCMERALDKFIRCADICLPPTFVSFGGDEFLVGRAGYLAGALWLNNEMEREAVPVSKMHEVCKSIVEYGRWYSQTNNHRCPLMYSYYKTEYLGAAHGLSSILQMLLTVPGYLSQYPESEKYVKQSVDYLLSLQTSDGNFPCAMDEIESNARPMEDSLVHWCHGAPGVIYLFAKAYLVWNEPKYLESCKKAAELTWHKGLLKKGPGICHGVAGNGYVLLLMYRLTNDVKYLHRANEFASFVLSPRFKDARSPDSPYSLYEGWAGTVVYLTDLMNPNKASFPFMDVF